MRSTRDQLLAAKARTHGARDLQQRLVHVICLGEFPELCSPAITRAHPSMFRACWAPVNTNITTRVVELVVLRKKNASSYKAGRQRKRSFQLRMESILGRKANRSCWLKNIKVTAILLRCWRLSVPNCNKKADDSRIIDRKLEWPPLRCYLRENSLFWIWVRFIFIPALYCHLWFCISPSQSLRYKS